MSPDPCEQNGGASRRADRSFAQTAFGNSFWVFSALAFVSGLACWVQLGWISVQRSLADDLELLVLLAPKIAAASQIAAFIPSVLPGEAVARLLGERVGLRGIALATLAGAVTPGGPITSFPLVAALRAAGSGDVALIAFVTSWSTLGLQRILMWEVPLMGAHFAGMRMLVSLPLPFIAAGIALALAARRRPLSR